MSDQFALSERRVRSCQVGSGQAGRLLPAEVPVVAAPSGSAPRHFTFHPNGRVFYNLYEHDAKVVVYDYDGATARMRHKQTIAASPQKFAGSILSSAIRMTTDGRFLYVANRLHSGLCAFAVAADGQLRMIADTWVHADSPRSIAIDPASDLLFSCQTERALRRVAALDGLRHAERARIDVVRTSYAGADEPAMKGWDFSETAIRRRWQAGCADLSAAVARFRASSPGGPGLRIHPIVRA